MLSIIITSGLCFGTLYNIHVIFLWPDICVVAAKKSIEPCDVDTVVTFRYYLCYSLFHASVSGGSHDECFIVSGSLLQEIRVSDVVGVYECLCEGSVVCLDGTSCGESVVFEGIFKDEEEIQRIPAVDFGWVVGELE